MDTVFEFPKMPGLVIAYHGCDKTIADRVILGKDRIKDSTNPYDWLGHGQYFWEGSEQRAFEWAFEASKRPNSSVKVPAVVGAVIDLGFCLNLTDSYCIDMVKLAYMDMKDRYENAGIPLPENKTINKCSDLLIRNLDCAVIEYLRETTNIELDTVRGVFPEGNPLYENAGFRDKTHIQICVINPKCVKGYFYPL